MKIDWVPSVLVTALLLTIPTVAAASKARCDFDNDGLSELAIGVPGDQNGVGAVYVLDFNGDPLLYDVAWFRPGHNVDSFGIAEDLRFGTALACGDFDGDGYHDLAVGAPGESNNAGYVAMLYGSPTGLQDPPWDGRLHQNLVDLNETMEEGDYFGAALVAGDFNHDGISDLGIGVPGETLPGHPPGVQGMVHILYGRNEDNASPEYHPGPSPLHSEQYYPNGVEINILGQAFYGRSLVAADLNDDGADDLAVGAPYATVDRSPSPNFPDFQSRAGAVHVMMGVAGPPLAGGGLDINTSVILSQFEAARTDELFGYSLAAGNFDGVDGVDLAVGVPLDKFGESFEEVGDGFGMVNLFEFSPLGNLVTATDIVIENEKLGDGFENRDLWGFALAAGDFDGNGQDDLVIGRPGEGFPFIGNTVTGGAVTVLYGEPGVGLENQVNHQRTIQNFTVPEDGQGYGFAFAVGYYLDPDELGLVVGAPGWIGEEAPGEPIPGAGAVTLFRAKEEVGLFSGSPSGLTHKALVEDNPSWAPMPPENEEIYSLPADQLLVGPSWAGERFGAALAH